MNTDEEAAIVCGVVRKEDARKRKEPGEGLRLPGAWRIAGNGQTCCQETHPHHVIRGLPTLRAMSKVIGVGRRLSTKTTR